MLSSSIFQGVNESPAWVSHKFIFRIDILSYPIVSVICYYHYYNAHRPPCSLG